MQANQHTDDYLYVTFELAEGTHEPYTKPEAPITYVNVQSDHPSHTSTS